MLAVVHSIWSSRGSSDSNARHCTARAFSTAHVHSLQQLLAHRIALRMPLVVDEATAQVRLLNLTFQRQTFIRRKLVFEDEVLLRDLHTASAMYCD